MDIHLSLLFTLFLNIHGEQQTEFNITCPEIYGFNLINYIPNLHSHSETTFFLASKNNDTSFQLGIDNWSALGSDNFNPARRTYIIIHGYKSTAHKKWVMNLKNILLKKRNVNVILVDWSKSSYRLNFIESVRSTIQVSTHLLQLLQGMIPEVNRLGKNVRTSWRELLFIGHSLGAHISGQTAQLLKKFESFFKVVRITGLDPAKPCFSQADNRFRLDKDDAEFVDVIHTQTGKSNDEFSFGLGEPTGYMDFYINGGVFQPECESKSIWKAKLENIICSHKISQKIFIESINTTKSYDSCKFVGRKWDRTYNHALQLLNETIQGKLCYDCPLMGINAIERRNPGTFIVFTSMEKPYCSIKDDDVPKIKKMLEYIEK